MCRLFDDIACAWWLAVTNDKTRSFYDNIQKNADCFEPGDPLQTQPKRENISKGSYCAVNEIFKDLYVSSFCNLIDMVLCRA